MKDTASVGGVSSTAYQDVRKDECASEHNRNLATYALHFSTVTKTITLVEERMTLLTDDSNMGKRKCDHVREQQLHARS